MKQIVLILAGISAALLGLTGCGSDGSSTTKLQQKTATITFSTVSSAHTAPLEGIQLLTYLPSGASITNVSNALTGSNNTGSVTQKNYVVLPPSISFMVMPTGAKPIEFGAFATLRCDIATGTTLDQNSFSVKLSDIQMTGKDVGGSTVNLEGQIPVKLSVSFGY